LQDGISVLLELQEADRRAAVLAHTAKRLQSQDANLQTKIAQERERVEHLQEDLATLERNSRSRNLEVDDLDAQIRDYKKRLNGGILSFKEMESLRKKIESQEGRMGTMEDEALTLMDEIEAAQARLDEAKAQLVSHTETLESVRTDLAGQGDALCEEIAALEASREEIATHVPDHLLNRYEMLRATFEDPVVLITGGACAGCKLKVSDSTVERARGGAEVVTCENCSRVLYVS